LLANEDFKKYVEKRYAVGTGLMDSIETLKMEAAEANA
jgi:hypothetical protein